MTTFSTLCFCLLVSFAGICQSTPDASVAHNEFSLRVYKDCVSDSSNLFISPYGLRVVLLATAEGSGGETRKQFDSLVSIGKPSDAKGFMCTIGKNGDRFFEPTTLEVANAMWANKDVGIKKSFVDLLRSDYNTEYFPFDPQDISRVAAAIDSWVAEKTHGNITNMPAPSPQTALAILNAVYFRDKWSIGFKRKKTKPKTFHAITGTKQTIDFMRMTETMHYFEDDELQALSLPYRSQFSMVVLLPRKMDGLISVEARINEEYFRKINSRFRLHPTTVLLPKFQIMNELDATSLLAEGGFAKLFMGSADLSGISTRADLQIGELIHKTFIEVDEKETVAAAVTEELVVTSGTGGGEPPPPPEPKIFNANHPFVFFIVDRMNNDAIVFAGRFVKD